MVSFASPDGLNSSSSDEYTQRTEVSGVSTASSFTNASAQTNDTDFDVDNYYFKFINSKKKKSSFFYSYGLKLQDRIQVFRNEYREFGQLDDNHVEALIKIYDFNLQ